MWMGVAFFLDSHTGIVSSKRRDYYENECKESIRHGSGRRPGRRFPDSMRRSVRDTTAQQPRPRVISGVNRGIRLKVTAAQQTAAAERKRR